MQARYIKEEGYSMKSTLDVATKFQKDGYRRNDHTTCQQDKT